MTKVVHCKDAGFDLSTFDFVATRRHVVRRLTTGC